jgi:hypothetical protein
MPFPDLSDRLTKCSIVLTELANPKRTINLTPFRKELMSEDGREEVREYLNVAVGSMSANTRQVVELDESLIDDGYHQYLHLAVCPVGTQLHNGKLATLVVNSAVYIFAPYIGGFKRIAKLRPMTFPA